MQPESMHEHSHRYTKWEHPFPVGDVVSFFLARHFGPLVRANGVLSKRAATLFMPTPPVTERGPLKLVAATLQRQSSAV